MDFVLNIVSEPRRRFRAATKSNKTSEAKKEKVTNSEPEKKSGKLPTNSRPEQKSGKSLTDSRPEPKSGKYSTNSRPDSKLGKSPTNSRPEQKSGKSLTDSRPESKLGKSPKRKLGEFHAVTGQSVESVGAPLSRKRPRSLVAEEEPAVKVAREEVERKDEGVSPETEAGVRSAGSGKEKKKTMTPKMRANRESSLNDLTALMNEPVEATIEGLFSSRKFSDVETLHPFLRSLLSEKMGMETMTEIQLKCLQPLLEGRDALVKAQTGSGKTLAYALPIVQRLQQQQPPVTRADGPLCLVIAPTRELVSQTQDMFARLLQPFIRIVSGALTGGVRRKAQKASLRRGLNVLVATPQRLLDHLRTTACLNLSRLAFLVIDEADRLLEVGFERDVRLVLSHLREARPPGSEPPQTVLLSATLTDKVKAMAGLALHEPIVLAASHGLETVALPAGLQNFVISPPTKQRLVTLAAFLLLKCRYTSKSGKVIVFMATQDTVDFHHELFSNTIACSSDDLTLPGITSEMELFRLHGNMEHHKRQAVFRRFSDCSVGGVLLTTDVACRGLDLPRVAWVVQYHVPGTPVDYVHRVGRTARAGGKGKALLFLQNEEQDYLRVLAGLGVTCQQMDVKAVMQAALVHVNNTASRGKKKQKEARLLHSTMEASVRLQRDLEHYVDDSECKALAEQAFLSYLRFYASFSGPMRDIFRFKALHLGHVAKTFALRGAPKDIAARVTGRAPRKLAASKTSGQESVPGWDIPQQRLDQNSAQKNLLAEFGI